MSEEPVTDGPRPLGGGATGPAADILRLTLDAPATAAPPPPRGEALALQEAIAAVRGSRFDADFALESRWGRLGRLSVLGKRLLRPLMRWYVVGLTDQLDALVEANARVLELMGRRLQQLDRNQVWYQSRLTELQRKLEQVPEEGAHGRARRAPSPDATMSSADASREVDQAIDYVEFEDHFRGSAEEIARRQSQYVDLFAGAPGRVLDIGCGRGEFLDLLRARGIEHYGIDRNPGMVDHCAALGHEVAPADALEHLSGLEPASLGGIFCAQVVEHLGTTGVVSFFELAARALRPGGRLVVETLNPRSLSVFAGALYVDLGHTRPLHPLTLKFLADRAGFEQAEIRYTSEIPEEAHVRRLPSIGDERLDPMLKRLDQDLQKIDELLFGPQDYAIVATR